MRWRKAVSDPPPRDGRHLLVCRGLYSKFWTFFQSPPFVVHYWPNPGEAGFYLSHGLVEGSHNDVPQDFDWWLDPLGKEPG